MAQIYTEKELIEIIGEYGGNKEQFYQNSHYLKTGYLKKKSNTHNSFLNQLDKIFTDVKTLRRKQGVSIYEVGEYKENIARVGDGRKNNKGRPKPKIDYEMAALFYPILCNTETFKNTPIGKTIEIKQYDLMAQLRYPVHLGSSQDKEAYEELTKYIRGYDARSVINLFETKMKNYALSNVKSMLDILNENKLIKFEEYQRLYDKQGDRVDENLYSKEDVNKVLKYRKRLIKELGLTTTQYYKTLPDQYSIEKKMIKKYLVQETGYSNARKYYKITLLKEVDKKDSVKKAEFLEIYYQKIETLIDDTQKRNEEKLLSAVDNEAIKKYGSFMKRHFKYHMNFVMAYQGTFYDQKTIDKSREAFLFYKELAQHNQSLINEHEQDKLIEALDIRATHITSGFFDSNSKVYRNIFEEFYNKYGYYYYKDTFLEIDDQLPF